MFAIVTSTKFLKDLKLLKKRSPKDLKTLQQLVTMLAEKGQIGLDKNIKLISLAAAIRDIGNAMLNQIYC